MGKIWKFKGSCYLLIEQRSMKISFNTYIFFLLVGHFSHSKVYKSRKRLLYRAITIFNQNHRSKASQIAELPYGGQLSWRVVQACSLIFRMEKINIYCSKPLRLRLLPQHNLYGPD